MNKVYPRNFAVPYIEQLCVLTCEKFGYSIHYENNGCVFQDKGWSGKSIKKVIMEKNRSLPLIFHYAAITTLKAQKKLMNRGWGI